MLPLPVAFGSEGSKNPWLCCRARWPICWLDIGEAALNPSREPRAACRGTAETEELPCAEAGPPAVDGLADGCCDKKGERFGAMPSTESMVALERDDSLRNESCDRDDCDR